LGCDRFLERSVIQYLGAASLAVRQMKGGDGYLGVLDFITKQSTKINDELKELFDLDFIGLDVEERLYIKNSAIETNVGFMARTISTADFRFMKDGKRVKHDFEYLLNVRPNKNQ